MRTRALLCILAALCGSGAARAADWPTVRGSAARTGFTRDSVHGPYRLQWTADFPGEVLATRVEAIVADGRVYVGTYSGNLYALDRRTGRVLWKHGGGAPVLHSPAFADGTVFYGTAGLNGALLAVDAATGRERWRFRGEPGGFAASPLVSGGTVYLGSRSGVFYAVESRTGRVRWRFRTGGPIRITAALAGDRVFFASDDMHAYCVSARTGEPLWKSEPLFGQSFRDYYPVVLDGKVLFRSVLVEETNDDLNGGTAFLQKLAGIRDGWKPLEEFLRSPRNAGTPPLIRAEQDAILERLTQNPYRRTCFLLDLETGRESVRAPVLYAAGNGGTGLPPARTAEGKTVLLYRTVYGNWSLGVKPAVGLGFLDPATGRIEPIRHSRGNSPPWNTFWGTSDESTNLSVGGDLLYLCHQGTLAALNLRTRDLFPIHGERDTWGGLQTPIWAANEWHGPARGSCAISDDQLFWVTGSRILAIGGRGTNPPVGGRAPAAVPAVAAKPASQGPATGAAARPQPQPVDFSERAVVSGIPEEPTRELRQALTAGIIELRRGWPWAPLYLQIGIGSRDFMFAHPSETVSALSLALPHLRRRDLAEWAQATARAALPRCVEGGEYSLKEGRRRELFQTPQHDLTWPRHPSWPPVSHLHAVWLYGDRTGDWESVRPLYPRCRALWEAYRGDPLVVDGKPGSLYRNRTLAGLIALKRIARRFEDGPTAEAAAAESRRLFGEILRDYRTKADIAAATLARLTSKGDIHNNQARFLYLELHNHKSKMPLFTDLTPEIGRALRDSAPVETETLRKAVSLWMPAYYLAAEERQVHYGENLIELPDVAHGLFRADAFLWNRSPAELAVRTDLPWCRGDLYHLEKLVFAMEAHGRTEWQ